MHPYMSTKAAQRRREPVVPGAVCLMKLTVAAGSITSLRQVVVRVCGDALQFMRIEACDHSQQMHVCLCVTSTSVDPVREAVRRYLPDAQFGAVTDANLAHLSRRTPLQ